MALGPRLDLRQSQSLVITPQLQQAIKLLQMSAVELTAYIDQELESNPLLEREDGGETESYAEAFSAEPTDDAVSGEATAPLDGRSTAEPDYNAQDYNASDDPVVDGRGTSADESLGAGAFSAVSMPGGSMGSGEGPNLDRLAANAQDLRGYLMQQINLSTMDATARSIGFALIEQLDENGYMTTPVAELAEQWGADEALIMRVLDEMKRFDPPGIFAGDLKECMKLQLIERDRFDPAMAAFIANLEVLGTGDLKKMRDVCGVSQEDVQDMIAEIRTLDPKPAQKFERNIDETVVPDIIMSPLAGGGWRIELNPQTLPRVLVNQSYVSEVSRVVSSKEEKQFLTERLQAANWLVKALQQRAETVLKVATEIVKQQEEFFRHGITHLKPLILRDVSTAIEMHESTVSRVTTNKFMETPRGVFELKYFFSQGLPSAGGGDAMSSESVRHRIKTLIDQEKADSVLSDDQLVDLLKAEGIDVARRTVAKYRESLNIPSSVQRRRVKALRF
ncbi:MAG: RNA polymerase factor sigma-54 [Rhodospirillaceae bacterium]|nr:RNA polymerase factor sigma-54 [Rhodospirillaceae bacterium]